MTTSSPAVAPPLLLTEALRDTISALEKSKDAFRSRELGDLRHRLEGLLDASKQPRPPHRITVEVHFPGRPEPATSFSGSLPAPPREGSRRDADSPARFRCVELVDY